MSDVIGTGAGSGAAVQAGGPAIGGYMDNQTNGADLFQIINQTAIDWYGLLTNRTSPIPAGGGASVRATAGGVTAQVSTQSLVMFGLVVVGVVFLLKK